MPPQSAILSAHSADRANANNNNNQLGKPTDRTHELTICRPTRWRLLNPSAGFLFVWCVEKCGVSSGRLEWIDQNEDRDVTVGM